MTIYIAARCRLGEACVPLPVCMTFAGGPRHWIVLVKRAVGVQVDGPRQYSIW